MNRFVYSLTELVTFRSRNQKHDVQTLTFSLCWHKAQFRTGTANYWFCAFSLSSSVLPKIVREHFTSLHRANHPFILYIHRICSTQHTTHMRWYGIRVFATLAKRIYTLYPAVRPDLFRNEREQCIKKAFLLCNTQMKRSNITDTGDVKFAHKLQMKMKMFFFLLSFISSSFSILFSFGLVWVLLYVHGVDMRHSIFFVDVLI